MNPVNLKHDIVDIKKTSEGLPSFTVSGDRAFLLNKAKVPPLENLRFFSIASL